LRQSERARSNPVAAQIVSGVDRSERHQQQGREEEE
jgi:hypothetical protein